MTPSNSAYRAVVRDLAEEMCQRVVSAYVHHLERGHEEEGVTDMANLIAPMLSMFLDLSLFESEYVAALATGVREELKIVKQRRGSPVTDDDARWLAHSLVEQYPLPPDTNRPTLEEWQQQQKGDGDVPR